MIDKTGLTLLSISTVSVLINTSFWLDSHNQLSMFVIGFSSAFAMLSLLAFYLANKDRKS